MGWVGGREDKLNFKSNNRRMGSYGSHGKTNIVGNKHSGWDWEQGGSYAGALEEKRSSGVGGNSNKRLHCALGGTGWKLCWSFGGEKVLAGGNSNKRLHCAQVTQGGSSCSLHSCAATSPSTQLCLLVRRKHASEQLLRISGKLGVFSSSFTTCTTP